MRAMVAGAREVADRARVPGGLAAAPRPSATRPPANARVARVTIVVLLVQWDRPHCAPLPVALPRKTTSFASGGRGFEPARSCLLPVSDAEPPAGVPRVLQLVENGKGVVLERDEAPARRIDQEL